MSKYTSEVIYRLLRLEKSQMSKEPEKPVKSKKMLILKKFSENLESQNVSKAYKLPKTQGIILGQWVSILMLWKLLTIRYCSIFNMVLLINYFSENLLWTMHVRCSFLSMYNEKLAYPFCVTSKCVSWGASPFSKCGSRYCKIKSLRMCSISCCTKPRVLLHPHNWKKNSTSLNFFIAADEWWYQSK